MPYTYLSISEFTGDGVTTEWDFNFAGGYISRDHVKVTTYDQYGVPTDVPLTDDNFVTDFRLTLTPPIAAGHTLRIFRDTPREEPIVNFTGGSNFTEANLDLLAKQTVFSAAEAFDAGAYAGAQDLLGRASSALSAAAAAQSSADAAVADAEAAATAAAAAVSDVAALTSFNVVSYGADPTGTVDSYAAFRAAINAAVAAGGGLVNIPRGSFRLGTPLQTFGAVGVHLRGAGMGATKLIRTTNLGAAQVRFGLGYRNSVSHLTLDADGYAGRGIFLQDIDSRIDYVEVINCPERPFAMHGGSNTAWGIDALGRDADSPNFSGAVFYPERCSIFFCRAENCIQTAYSQKQMHRSMICYNYARRIYSEAVTVDATNWALVHGNTFQDVSLYGMTWPDKVNGGTLVNGGGGVGGMGIDAALHARVTGNSWHGVATNIIDRTARSRAAINFVNNITSSTGCVVAGNTIVDAKLGIRIMDGTAGASARNYKHIISNNAFSATARASTSGMAEYGDVWIGAAGSVRVEGNTSVGQTLLVTDAVNNNYVQYDEPVTVTPTITFGGVDVTTTGALMPTRTVRYEREGRSVQLEVKVVFTNKGTGVGPVVLTGLPLEADINSVCFNQAYLQVGTAPPQAIQCQVVGTRIEFYDNGALLDAGVLANGTRISVNGTYRV